MKTQGMVELVTDAVVDAVREAIPQLVSKALDTCMAQRVTPALEQLDRQIFGIQAHVQERITEMQCDFSKRCINQADALTTSWTHQVATLRGSIVDQVAQAVAGVTSPPGAAGPPGPPGPPGRDGAITSPVHWKPDTTFPRGAMVQHKNGLWYANTDTTAEPGTGVDGYLLMFDGHELSGYETDEAGYQVAVYRYASGLVRKVSTGMRPMGYAGVYDHETSYHLNDVVTCEGSMWVCRLPVTLGRRPRTDDGARAWQLAVKCGRDGATGPRGERGEPGPPGASVIRAPKEKANGATP